MKNNHLNSFGRGNLLDITEVVVEALKVAGIAALVKIANIIVEAQKETAPN